MLVLRGLFSFNPTAERQRSKVGLPLLGWPSAAGRLTSLEPLWPLRWWFSAVKKGSGYIFSPATEYRGQRGFKWTSNWHFKKGTRLIQKPAVAFEAWFGLISVPQPFGISTYPPQKPIVMTQETGVSLRPPLPLCGMSTKLTRSANQTATQTNQIS